VSSQAVGFVADCQIERIGFSRLRGGNPV